MEQYADRTPLEVVTYRSEKTRSDAVTNARCRAEELTKKTGRKHSYRHAKKLDRDVYEIFAIDIEPIEAAVAPLKKQAIERAEQDTLALIEKCRAELAEHGGDLNSVAPYSNGHYGSLDYYMKQYRRNLFEKITTSSTDRYQSYSTNQPYYVKIEEGRAAKFVERRKAEAGEQYDEFVAKLISKVGDVREASIDGSHVWGYSILTVTLLDGTIQKWKTQQIVNVSKLGKHFNQWPTRLMKR